MHAIICEKLVALLSPDGAVRQGLDTLDRRH